MLGRFLARGNFIALVSIAFLSAVIFLFVSSSDGKPNGTPLNKADEVVQILERADYSVLASYVNRDEGLKFLPYIHDLTELQISSFSKDDLLSSMAQDKIATWGTYDGSGAPIKLTLADYHSSFVYDFPYATDAAVKSIEAKNAELPSGLNAVGQHFDGATFVLYRYEGSPSAAYNDWRDLLLIFRQIDNEWYLIGIGHGEKTI